MKKHFVYNLNSKGFLLLEHLITLLITSLLMMTLLSILQVTKSYTSNTDAVLLNELEALATQLQIESQFSLSFSSPYPHLLNLHKSNGDTISYFISDERLMRQVNGKGGEVALYHCKTLTIEDSQDSYATVHLKTSSQSMTLYLNTFNLPLPNIELLDEALDEDSLSTDDLVEENTDTFLPEDDSLEEDTDTSLPEDDSLKEDTDDSLEESDNNEDIIDEELVSDDSQ